MYFTQLTFSYVTHAPNITLSNHWVITLRHFYIGAYFLSNSYLKRQKCLSPISCTLHSPMTLHILGCVICYSHHCHQRNPLEVTKKALSNRSCVLTILNAFASMIWPLFSCQCTKSHSQYQPMRDQSHATLDPNTSLQQGLTGRHAVH